MFYFLNTILNVHILTIKFTVVPNIFFRILLIINRLCSSWCFTEINSCPCLPLGRSYSCTVVLLLLSSNIWTVWEVQKAFEFSCFVTPGGCSCNCQLFSPFHILGLMKIGVTRWFWSQQSDLQKPYGSLTEEQRWAGFTQEGRITESRNHSYEGCCILLVFCVAFGVKNLSCLQDCSTIADFPPPLGLAGLQWILFHVIWPSGSIVSQFL